jgi:hypothetical protein
VTTRVLPLLLTSFALAAPAPGVAEALDLAGTWYVLVHYKDDGSDHPERERWDDRVWVFERRGDRLEWSEYPLVVFEDETGRFEALGTNRAARILHFWEPSQAQLVDIRNGLQVNSRGAKHKSLRGSDADGWSSGRRGAVTSASTLTYQEVWSIEGLPEEPVFTRNEYLSGAFSDELEGITRYSGQEIDVEGGLIRGAYVRDGTRRGTFRMLRSEPVGPSSGRRHATPTGALQRRIEQSPELREEVRNAALEAASARGVTLSEADLEAVVDAVAPLASRGASEREIRKAVREMLER